MEKIYVFGHKNPDSDSICSSIVMTELQHKLGNTQAIACRLGEVSRETMFALNSFNAEKPLLISSVAGKNVILVDHNERPQTADDIDSAKILEVVDHHKFNFMTNEPVKITADTVGCTSTILYRLFKQNNLTPSKMAAGLMMSAIISDTLLFKSPTCTPEDIKAVEELAKIAETPDFKDYGMKLLIEGTSLSDKTPDEIITLDMKEFDMNGKKVAIAQVNTVDINGILETKADLENAMQKLIDENNYDLFVLIITDIIKAGSYALAVGESVNLVENGFNVKLENNMAWLEGVVSRKKQVVPNLMK